MGDIIEEGYEEILDRIHTAKEKITTSSQAIQKEDALLIEKMVNVTAPLVKEIGLSLLRRGKTDTKGEVYDAEYYQQKMIALGKTDPEAFQQSGTAKKITDQFLVLGEDGVLSELQYTSDGFFIDSFLNPLTLADALATYGNEPAFMLYHAMKEYLKGQEELVNALEKTLNFIHGSWCITDS